MNETLNPQETAQPKPITNQAPPPPQTTQAETLPVSTTEKKKKPILPIILSILLVLSLGAAGYFSYMYYQLQIPGIASTENTEPTPSPTPIPTPLALETYTNKTLNYQITLPENWWVEEEYEKLYASSSGEIMIINNNKFEEYRLNNIRITSSKRDKSYLPDSQKEFDFYINNDSIPTDPKRIIKLENTMVDQLPAVKYINKTLNDDPTELFYSIITWFRKDNINYYITIGASNQETVEKQIPAYNKIVSTFKFTQ